MDFDDDLDDFEVLDSLEVPCPDCGETTSCGTDFEGRPLFHRQVEDGD